MNFLKQFQNQIKEKNKDVEEQVIKPVVEEEVLLPEGIYSAIVKESTYLENVPSKYGMAKTIENVYSIIQETEFGVPIPHDIKQRYYVSQNEHSRYTRHLRAILGKDPRTNEYTTKDLVGVAVEVRVKHNFSDGRTYKNIEDIRLLDLSLEKR